MIRTQHHTRRHALLAAACLCTNACTYGAVQDAETGVEIGGAEVSFQLLLTPDSVPANHVQPQVSLDQIYGAETWSADDPRSNGIGGLYYRNPYAPADDVTPAELGVWEGWNAVTVSASGYETRRFYRNHVYAPCRVLLANPYSAGPHPLVLAGVGTAEGLCKEQNFGLHASGSTHEKLPDLIVDPRSLLDQLRTPCRFPGNSCLTVFASVANAGEGDLFIVAPAIAVPPGEPGIVIEPVLQLISSTDGSLRSKGLLALFENRSAEDGGTHAFKLNGPQGWMKLRLRRVDPQVCDLEALAGDCPIASDQSGRLTRLSCLHDGAVFDPSYVPERAFTGCEQSDVWSDGSQTFFSEGLSAGRALPASSSSGASIDLTGLAAGDYWLEAEVNPDREIEESDYDNNIARVAIQL